MIAFGIKYWFIFLPLIVVLSGLVVLVLYYKNKDNVELTKKQIRILSVLRFLSVLLVGFLLLSPFIKSLKKIVQNPVIIAAWDNSASMISIPDSAQIKEKINQIEEQIQSDLGNSFKVVHYSFGENTRLSDSPDFSDKNSNYSELLSTINNNHFNENIGAVIIAGDGIYNRGINPVNMSDEITYPIYTVGLGDTLEVTDARIENIRANRTSFTGNRFPVEIETYFSKLGNTSLRLTIFQGETEIERTIVTPSNDDYFVRNEFILDAGSPGLKHFSVQIEAAENERNMDNNTSEFVINVLENKQKILILSDGPHPDVGAIKNTLDLQQTYEVSVFTEEPYPLNLEDFNLIILNQLPSSAKSASEIVEKAKQNRLPLLFIVGNTSFLPQLNALDLGTEVRPLAGSGEEVQATVNPGFRIFTLSEELIEMIRRFPPLFAPFADYNMDSEFSTLLYQKIRNIETAKPLIATANLNGRKTGFIFGEGIWRWRLYNYYFEQDQARFSELVNQLIQYLALRENEDNFIVDFQSIYAETEEVTFRAEVYNESYEKVTSEEVKIKITNAEGKEFDFTFDGQGDNYFLNAGHLPNGDYSFVAEVILGNETFTEEGSFTVVAVNIENTISKANHQVLFQLAGLSGGKFYLPSQSSELTDEIKNSQELKASVYFQEMVNELLNLRWLFAVLLILFSVEWFLRKYWGIY